MKFVRRFFTLGVLASLMVGCASFDQIHACNKLAYQQAPPVYDSRQVRLMMQCPMGIGPFGPMFPKPGMPMQPFYCQQMEFEDLNVGARRSVFNACMNGITATPVLVEPASDSVTPVPMVQPQ